ncbi:unnamed protein product [Didymodactylos carnosus]|uniref:Uncharacterized protein n=1 Tax=Didymodactylos carnosus TaxID=1234261 RepID=A0A814D8Q0_9BILA|nr:unnamed protein product [Didymodactylos carnosus]CAF1003735.1 unnamed protein product [Didymodactylos carnosus]CAF3725567.1 unnamed protein product [Didymodactylos carnosus]CAF3773048.1 unnamed protein product [Didymodactylos carnosus]
MAIPPLGIPASSTTSERISSASERILEERRQNLNSDVVDNIEIYHAHSTISQLSGECRRCLQVVSTRPQLFSYSHEQFNPPPTTSNYVDITDLEIAVLLVDLMTLKQENCELRWNCDILYREKKLFKEKIHFLEVNTKEDEVELILNNSSHTNIDDPISLQDYQTLITREKTLRAYVYRLYQLLQTTTKQLKQRQEQQNVLMIQFKLRNKELIEQIQQIEEKYQQKLAQLHMKFQNMKKAYNEQLSKLYRSSTSSNQVDHQSQSSPSHRRIQTTI